MKTRDKLHFWANWVGLSICIYFGITLAFSPLAFGQSGFGEKAIQILGKYSYIYSNGAPPETNDYQFIAITSDSGWNISITNINNPKEWGVINSDGTNIFTLSTDSLNKFKTFGYVFRGPFYVPDDPQNSVIIFFPWMVFHLTPSMIRDSEKKGIIDKPAPWGKHHSLIDFGFRWKTSFFEGGEAIQKIEAVRDKTLDLKNEEDELRRANINYPYNFSLRQQMLDSLQTRTNIPDGFVRAVYECNATCRTNGWVIPCSAQFALYWPNFKNPQESSRLLFRMQLRVEKIDLLKDRQIPAIISPSEASVWDYRAQTATGRTKFNYAEYALQRGEPFPASNDPKLLAQMNDWLKQGPPYEILTSKRRKILTGMVIFTVMSIGLLAFWLIKQTKSKKTL